MTSNELIYEESMKFLDGELSAAENKAFLDLIEHEPDALFLFLEKAEALCIEHHHTQLEETQVNELLSLVRHLVEETHKSKQQEKWALLHKIVFIKPSTLAVADNQSANQKILKSALGTAELVFTAMLEKENLNYWRAAFTLPQEPREETILTVRLYDGKGGTINEGIFVFCGIQKPVKNGKCFITIVELREHLKKQSVSFVHSNGVTVEGVLELFP